MGLCEQCQSMTTKVLVHGRNSLFRHDHVSLEKAVYGGCFICSRVWDSLTEEQKAVASDPAFEGIEYQILLKRITYGEDGEQQEILATLSFEHGDDLFDCEDYNVVGGERIGETGCFTVLNPSLFPVHKAPKLPASTNHPLCWNTVSRWIDDCCSKHATCPESQQPEWMPTRLVDISEYENGHVRIVDSSTIPEDSGEFYLALSHCWGRKPFLVMRQHSRVEFEEGVLVSSLAPNFQDAIFMTRRLGFRYIWIDSLCIIQGSEEDWNKEAPLMNKVYSHAFLTLGAMASPHGYGGLFRSRDPEMANPCPFKLRTEDEGDMDCLLVNSDLWESQVRKAPLSQRAWVVQERILAPRSLYFGEGQLFWECRKQFACEVFPDGIPLGFLTEIKETFAVDAVSVKAFEATLRKLREVGPDDDQSDDDGTPWTPKQYETPYQVWNDILEAYVKCALTNPGDKLVALSGIVKEFAKGLDDEYLAGLWRKNLINGLLWVAKDDFLPGAPSTVRPVLYRAPSWSWASLDAPSAYTQENNLYGDYVRILDVEVVPRGDDPTGQVSHACLHLRGHLIETRRKPVYSGGSAGFGKFIADTQEMPGDEFYCLPLREWRFDGMSCLRGLVLAPLPEENETAQPLCGKCSLESKFVRVGTFQMDEGEPLKYLGMRKPSDWEDWGDERDHLWFDQDIPISDFVII